MLLLRNSDDSLLLRDEDVLSIMPNGNGLTVLTKTREYTGYCLRFDA